MQFTLDAQLTVNVSLRNLPAAAMALRAGNFDELLDRVDIVDATVDVSR